MDIKRSLDSKESSEEVVLRGETHADKVLGTVLLPKEDKFSFKIKIESASVNDKSTAVPVKLTKRQILSKLAGTFNPVGAGATVLFKPKTAMQQLWQIGLGWDEDVPPNERIKCLALFEKMTAFNYVKFDQYLTFDFWMPYNWLLGHVPTQDGSLPTESLAQDLLPPKQE